MVDTAHMTTSNRVTDPWRWRLAMTLYRVLAPCLLGIALPSWLKKMIARDGWCTPFGERFGLYRDDIEWAPCGRMHLHAVSVGETLIALKFLQAWRQRHAEPVVLAVGTATAYQIAIASTIDDLSVVYAPLDIHSFVWRYLQRFEPAMLVLVEAEAWPVLMTQCQKRAIPVCMINARLSPRSERRFRKVRDWIMPLFDKISCMGVQGQEDAARFAALGINADHLRVTGSIKFDPLAATSPQTRQEFAAILSPIIHNRFIVLAASTHDGEELLFAHALRDSKHLFVCVPRHAERRHEVKQALTASGLRVWLRSDGAPPSGMLTDVLIIDSTGELRDWTAHADVVIIGKSFLSTGGQNPAEAILAEKPLIVGPHMENFEPLTSQLLAVDGIIRIHDVEHLSTALTQLLENPHRIKAMTLRSKEVLQIHAGATERSISMVEQHLPS
jgi:3-deoxy-D-manno-octulosonic-acid transferase